MKNTTWKALFVLFFTFAIGFILGTTTTKHFIRHQIHQLFGHTFTYPPPIQHWLHTIQPTELQKKQFTPIVEEYATEYRNNQKESHQKSLVLQQNMLKELNMYLTEEQKKAVQNHLNKIEEHEQKRKTSHHPPPFHH